MASKRDKNKHMSIFLIIKINLLVYWHSIWFLKHGTGMEWPRRIKQNKTAVVASIKCTIRTTIRAKYSRTVLMLYTTLSALGFLIGIKTKAAAVTTTIKIVSGAFTTCIVHCALCTPYVNYGKLPVQQNQKYHFSK